MFRFLPFLLLAAALAACTQPRVIEDAGDPKLDSAIALWLDDDDRESLPTLAALAAEGSTVARLLLGRIEVAERAPSAYVQSLSRQARFDLFRPASNGAVFRPTWLRSEAKAGHSLAQALDEAMALGLNLPAVERLYALGEREAAEHLVIKLAIDGSQEEKDRLAALMGPEADLLPYVRSFGPVHEPSAMGRNAFRYVRARQGESDPDKLPEGAEAEAVIRYLGIGYQSGFSANLFSKDNRFYPLIADWIESAPQTGPIVASCAKICSPTEVRHCAVVAVGMTGGYYEAIRLDSPLESIIPQERYLRSKRAEATALRRVAFARSELLEEVFALEGIRARSACLAAAVEVERDKVAR